MKFRALCLAVACMSVLPAAAQTALERMEVISEQVSTLMNEAMIAQMPDLEGRMPDPNWDDPMRAGFACVLEAYEAQSGAAEIDALLDRMDAALQTATPETLMTGGLDADIGLPDGVDEDESIAIMNRCGVIEMMMERMVASGAMEVMRGQ